MLDILTYLPSRRKSTSSGWISFNAPCCTHNGESADRRQRGGIKASDQGWSYHCFNCRFTASFIRGRTLSFKARRFLTWLGVPQEEIERINLDSLRERDGLDLVRDRMRVMERLADIEFEERELPWAELITQEHQQHWQYLRDRCMPTDYPFMIEIHTPNQQSFENGVRHVGRQGILIPFTHHGQIVGHTTRFLDDRRPKYIHDIQSGYVFGVDLQKPDWQHALVVEGVFDALSINALAVLHAKISENQARLIRGLGRDITVVPDQDQSGLALVYRALELGWAVSMPEWPSDVKDVNDAVKRYGRLATLITIMQARETSRIKIELKRRQLAKRL